ncbi:MAG: hypothetical protein ACR2J3_12385 [Aridibacter sp.]
MSQVLEQDIEQSEEFYKAEFYKILEKIKLNNQKMKRDEEEFDRLELKSQKTLERIDQKILEIEKTLVLCGIK